MRIRRCKGDKDKKSVELPSSVFALDSITIEFCVSVGEEGKDFINFGNSIAHFCKNGYRVETFNIEEDEDNICIKAELTKEELNEVGRSQTKEERGDWVRTRSYNVPSGPVDNEIDSSDNEYIEKPTPSDIVIT